MNIELIDQVANAIGSADIGAAWSVNDYPDAYVTERYRKLARAALEALAVRRYGCVLLVVDDRRDHLLEALDCVMVRERQAETMPMVITNSISDLLPKIEPALERPRENWRRGRPLP